MPAIMEVCRETRHRRNSVRQLRWVDLDLSARTVCWQGEYDKTGKESVTPLSESAVRTLLGVPRVLGSPWVFPARWTPPGRYRTTLSTSGWPAPRSGSGSTFGGSATMGRSGRAYVPAIPGASPGGPRGDFGDRARNPYARLRLRGPGRDARGGRGTGEEARLTVRGSTDSSSGRNERTKPRPDTA